MDRYMDTDRLCVCVCVRVCVCLFVCVALHRWIDIWIQTDREVDKELDILGPRVCGLAAPVYAEGIYFRPGT